MSDYPCFDKCILIVAADNCLGVKPRSQWVYPENIKEIEAELAKLTDQELNEFCFGDITSVLKKYPDVKKADETFNTIYEGSEFSNFYMPASDTLQYPEQLDNEAGVLPPEIRLFEPGDPDHVSPETL